MEKKFTQLSISSINVEDRVRKDYGDLTELMDSMREGGLVNPLDVMERGNNYLLLCGERRLRAAKALGWETIDAMVYDAMDAAEAIKLEFRENKGRKDWDDSERVAWGLKIESIETAKSHRRMQTITSFGSESRAVEPVPPPERGKTRDIAAKAVGYNTGRHYEHAKEVVLKRPDLAEEVKKGKNSITGAYRKLREDEGRPLKPRIPKTNALTANRYIPTDEQKKASLKDFKENFVKMETIPIGRPDVYIPTAIEVKGDPDTIEGAQHDQLLKNPLYKRLYERYSDYVNYAGSLRDMLENKLRTLRSVQQNNHDMYRKLYGDDE
ncbi:hypothetical protein FACS1894184_09260 [Clostridia bacterium]|nr:hypothetical protein FACS1894184_09260 [Clostridia bacterium]